jgi:polyhydroxyalkanoate synthesis regulator phasin
MSLTTLILAQVVETIAGHRANGFVASGAINADEARAYVTAAKMLADIELKAMRIESATTAQLAERVAKLEAKVKP